MRLVTIGELDTHREESPELIDSEAVEDIGEAGETRTRVSRALGLM